MPPRRIHIIGGPGSGKTTLAKKLSQRWHIKHYDLDDCKFKRRYDLVRPIKERRALLEQIIKQDAWILEGAYTDWPKIAYPQAEVIIILRPPLVTRTYRILKRFINAQIGMSKEQESWKSLKQMLSWHWTYNQDLKAHEATLKPYQHKIIAWKRSRIRPQLFAAIKKQTNKQ